MSLSRSGIEYLDYSWNPVTGCKHGLDICTTADTCWAKAMAHRFHRSFIPTFHPEKLEGVFSHYSRPGRVGVCFNGDLFGDWVPQEWIEEVLQVVKSCSVHTFLFLTKNPHQLAQFNPWPPNTWVGCTITGAETPEQQQQMMAALCRVEGGKRWVSYEPTLASLSGIAPQGLMGISWVVISPQSGRGAKKPQRWWLQDAMAKAGNAGAKVWLKNNALEMFPELPKRQELPYETQNH